MASRAITTVVKMLETLPEATQAQVAEHLREYIAEVQDEAQWDAQFQQTQKQLVAAARKAKQEIAAGLAEPMDYTQLLSSARLFEGWSARLDGLSGRRKEALAGLWTR